MNKKRTLEEAISEDVAFDLETLRQEIRDQPVMRGQGGDVRFRVLDRIVEVLQAHDRKITGIDNKLDTILVRLNEGMQ